MSFMNIPLGSTEGRAHSAAIASLAGHFRGQRWFCGVAGNTTKEGVAVLLVYRNAVQVDVQALPLVWEGFPVLVRSVAGKPATTVKP